MGFLATGRVGKLENTERTTNVVAFDLFMGLAGSTKKHRLIPALFSEE